MSGSNVGPFNSNVDFSVNTPKAGQDVRPVPETADVSGVLSPLGPTSDWLSADVRRILNFQSPLDRPDSFEAPVRAPVTVRAAPFKQVAGQVRIPRFTQYDPTRPSSSSALFIPKYDDSRAQFLADCDEVKRRFADIGMPSLVEVQTIAIPHKHFDPEKKVWAEDNGPVRYIDVLHIKALDRENYKALIMNTGVHGPEAAYDAAVCRSLLGSLDRINFFNTDVTLVHAANPQGWAEMTREAQGVDLNRSDFVLQPGETAESVLKTGNDAAQKVNAILSKHQGPAGTLAEAEALVAEDIAKGIATGQFTTADFENALGYGQDQDPNAAAYASTVETPEIKAITEAMSGPIAGAKETVMLDVHSGVEGKVSFKQKIDGSDRLTAGLWLSLGQTDSDARYTAAITRNAGTLLKALSVKDLAYADVADIPYGAQRLPRSNPKAPMAALTFEQATVRSLQLPKLLAARINQYWGTTYGWRSPEDRLATEQTLRNGFLPMDDKRWVASATQNMAQLMNMLAGRGHFLDDTWKYSAGK